MRTVRNLVDNENLAKLLQAQRLFNKAAALFNEVFNDDGHPNEIEEVQEGFFSALGVCQLKMERLVGSVVYHDIFTSL